jgi:hypothetical protein
MTQVNWELVPHNFQFLRKAVELCGNTRILPFDPIEHKHISFAERATDVQLKCLESVWREIVGKGTMVELQKWVDGGKNGSEAYRVTAWYIGGILGTLYDLAEMGIVPFAEASIFSGDPREMMGIVPLSAARRDSVVDADLPDGLEYLVEPARRFGERYVSESQMLLFVDEASDEEIELLAALSERIRTNCDFEQIMAWINSPRNASSPIKCDFDRLIHLMDICGFRFESDQKK